MTAGSVKVEQREDGWSAMPFKRTRDHPEQGHRARRLQARDTGLTGSGNFAPE